VWEERPIFAKEKASVCGAYWDPELRCWNSQKQPSPAPSPVAQAFEATRQFALKERFSAIWIDDPRRLFADGDVKLWVQNGHIALFDDHS
jgi:hypothetical protein